jgi:hypothetical protein
MSKEIFYPLLLLLIPFIGTLFYSDVNWGLFDFIIMGGLLTLLGAGFKRVNTQTKNLKLRILFMGVLVFLFLAVWGELAVGIFSSCFSGT